jgi:hypothetical protein
MSYNYNNRSGLQGIRGAKDVFDQRKTARRVQNLGLR